MPEQPWIILTHVHRELAPVRSDEFNEVLPLDMLRGTRTDVCIETAGDLGDYTRIDWQRLQDSQAAQLERTLRPLLDQGRAVAYFGVTPIPLAIDLGFRVNSWPRVKTFLYDRGKKNWHWPGRGPDEEPPLVHVEGIPDVVNPASEDVIVRVSVSLRIHPGDTRACVPDPLAEVDIHLGDACGDDSLRTPEDLDLVVEQFRRALKRIQTRLPGTRRIHLFAAVPVGLAFRLGTVINPTIQPPVQTYQYAREAKYQKAVVVGGRTHRMPMIAPERVDILFMAATPKTANPLRTDIELREIKKRLEQGTNRERFGLMGPVPAVQAREFQRSIRKHRAHIVHFSGHGEKGPGGEPSVLIVEDDSGNTQRLRPMAVQDMFRIANHDHRIKCVVLNACHSEALAQALVREPAAVPCVIGTCDKVDDDAAIFFADGFYSALADGEPLQRAFDYGKNQVRTLARRESQADLFVLAVADTMSRDQPLFGR